MKRSICGVQDVYYIRCLQDINLSLNKSKISFCKCYSANKLYKMIKEGDYDIEKGDPWPTISEKAKDLIRKLLTIDPE